MKIQNWSTVYYAMLYKWMDFAIHALGSDMMFEHGSGAQYKDVVLPV